MLRHKFKNEIKLFSTCLNINIVEKGWSNGLNITSQQMLRPFGCCAQCCEIRKRVLRATAADIVDTRSICVHNVTDILNTHSELLCAMLQNDKACIARNCFETVADIEDTR